MILVSHNHSLLDISASFSHAVPQKRLPRISYSSIIIECATVITVKLDHWLH